MKKLLPLLFLFSKISFAQVQHDSLPTYPNSTITVGYGVITIQQFDWKDRTYEYNNKQLLVGPIYYHRRH